MNNEESMMNFEEALNSLDFNTTLTLVYTFAN